MSQSCPDCGCKVYNGRCVNCDEESYIYEQDQWCEDPTEHSKEFMDKVNEQMKKARENERYGQRKSI